LKKTGCAGEGGERKQKKDPLKEEREDSKGKRGGMKGKKKGGRPRPERDETNNE